MRHIVPLSAVVVAIFALYAGAFTTKSATILSPISVDVMKLQKQADPNLPLMVIDYPV